MSTTIHKYKTDVLIVGGGLAGSVAAIEAAKEGLDVIVLEQTNTYRSGNAGSGLDHIYTYIPEIHERVGYTRDSMKWDQGNSGLLSIGLGFTEITDHFVDVCTERILGLEDYGLKMRFDDAHLPGGFRLVPQFHSIPNSINFDGRDIKPVLTEEMKKIGVQIINRASVVKLLSDGKRVSGALALSTRDDSLIAVSAKATVMATSGGFGRIAQKPNPTQRNNELPSAVNYGAGTVLALNAGAEVINLEFSLNNGHGSWPNMQFMAGAPGGTWWPAARIIDDEGNVVIDRIVDYPIDEPDYRKKNAEQIEEFNRGRGRVEELLSSGKQLYLDLSQATQEEIDYILWAMGNEGQMWLFREHLRENKINLRDVRAPHLYKPTVSVHDKCVSAGVFGVLVNERCETTLDGLYVGGPEMGGAGNICAPGAVVFGIEAGIQAAKKSKNTETIPDVDEKEIEGLLSKIEDVRASSGDASWDDVEGEVQTIVSIFGRAPFSEHKTKIALKLLEALKRRPIAAAKNQWELTKIFETESVIEVAIAVFKAIEGRKESFGPFLRAEDGGKGRAEIPSGGAGAEILGLYKKDGVYLSTKHIGNTKEQPA